MKKLGTIQTYFTLHSTNKTQKQNKRYTSVKITCLFSLVTTIKVERKDLLEDIFTTANSVFDEAPPNFFQSVYHTHDWEETYSYVVSGSIIPGIGGLMMATFLPTCNFDPHRWYYAGAKR
jgi:hypothetical protein